MTDPTVRTTRRRVAVAGAGAAAALGTVVGTAAVLDPGGRGAASQTAAIAAMMAVLGGGAFMVATAIGTVHQRDRAAATWAMVPMVFWLTASPALGISEAWWTVLLLVAVGLLHLLGRFAAGPEPRRPADGQPPAEAIRLPVSGHERLVWTRTVGSRPALALAGLTAAVAAWEFWLAATGSRELLVVGGFMTVAACGAILRTRVRVRVGAAGVRVEQPLLRRELATAPMDEIQVARAVPLDPSRLGITEYGVLRSSGVAGYRATRHGEALALELTGGREFLVTVPDAGTAAGLINAELDRQRSGEGDLRC